MLAELAPIVIHAGFSIITKLPPSICHHIAMKPLDTHAASSVRIERNHKKEAAEAAPFPYKTITDS